MTVGFHLDTDGLGLPSFWVIWQNNCLLPEPLAQGQPHLTEIGSRKRSDPWSSPRAPGRRAMELNKRPSSLSLVLCPSSPTQGQDKEPCALATCAFSGWSALSKSSWTRDHLAASGSPWLNTTSDQHRLAMTLSSLAGGQGALPSGAGQGCSCSSPMATCRGDAALS